MYVTIVLCIIIVVQAYVIRYMAWDSSYGCFTRAALNIIYPVLRTLGYTIILGDVDKFKQLNSIHGHETVNGMVKGAIRQFVRSGDIVFRLYSGDEFAVATRSHRPHAIMHRLYHVFAAHGMQLTSSIDKGDFKATMVKILEDKKA